MIFIFIEGYKDITTVNDVQPDFRIICWIKTTSPEGEMVTWDSSDDTLTLETPPSI